MEVKDTLHSVLDITNMFTKKYPRAMRRMSVGFSKTCLEGSRMGHAKGDGASLIASRWMGTTLPQREGCNRKGTVPQAYAVYCDGASRGNPGLGGCGAVLYDPLGNLMHQICRYVGDHATNNSSEYHGILLGMEVAQRCHVSHLRVCVDSQLVCAQMNGLYRVRSPGLMQLHQDAKKMCQQFDFITFEHVYRDCNRIADGLANQGIDLYQKSKEHQQTENGIEEGDLPTTFYIKHSMITGDNNYEK